MSLKDTLLNTLGERLTEEKNSLNALPTSVVGDWDKIRQQADEGMREAMTVISRCQHNLSEYEDDLEDKMAREAKAGISTPSST